MTFDAAPKFQAPRWYRLVLWPVLALVLMGVICLLACLGIFIVGLLSHSSASAPGWLVTVGIVCVGIGGFAGRIIQMVLAIQKRRWAKDHPGAPLTPDYFSSQPQASDDAAVESLGLRFTETGNKDS